jgi:hypothetical protein
VTDKEAANVLEDMPVGKKLSSDEYSAIAIAIAVLRDSKQSCLSNSVPVQATCVVNHDGTYEIEGTDSMDEEDIALFVKRSSGYLGGPLRVFKIVAYLPQPQVVEVKAASVEVREGT